MTRGYSGQKSSVSVARGGRCDFQLTAEGRDTPLGSRAGALLPAGVEAVTA